MGEPVILHMKSWRERNCWARLPNYDPGSSWNAGSCTHCAVWDCATPWGAVYGAWRLHASKSGPLYLDKRGLLAASLILTVIAAGCCFGIGIAAGWGMEGLLAAAGGDALAASAVLQWLASRKWAR